MVATEQLVIGELVFDWLFARAGQSRSLARLLHHRDSKWRCGRSQKRITALAPQLSSKFDQESSWSFPAKRLLHPKQ
jgi:hypothetical protein